MESAGVAVRCQGGAATVMLALGRAVHSAYHAYCKMVLDPLRGDDDDADDDDDDDDDVRRQLYLAGSQLPHLTKHQHHSLS